MTQIKSPRSKFCHQRCRAKERGIEWIMTFEEWWSIWQASGKWGRRGNRDGDYVMARHGDLGPYAPWNVSIITHNENISTAHARKRKLPIGVYLYRGLYMTRRREKFIGNFATPEEAEAAYHAAAPEQARAA